MTCLPEELELLLLAAGMKTMRVGFAITSAAKGLTEMVLSVGHPAAATGRPMEEKMNLPHAEKEIMEEEWELLPQVAETMKTKMLDYATQNADKDITGLVLSVGKLAKMTKQTLEEPAGKD